MTEPDEHLVQRMAVRGEEALAELYRRYAPYLLAMARRMLRDPDERQQAVQDAFVNAWNAADRFNAGKASVKTWLVTIAHRLILNRLRGERPQTVPFEDWDTPNSPPEGDRVTTLYVQEAVAELAQDERELIELAFFQGHSHQELADLTGRPLGTVKTKLRSALGQLRERLQEAPDDR
ncbi:MAG: sigma-70 family RNA polymerase sigma factor [Deinococcota bacterium]|nr:sigma-70 family RNA polymerase sigma factor [Deinococcota bacterium]